MMFKISFQKLFLLFTLFTLFISVLSKSNINLNLLNSDFDNKFVLLNDKDLKLSENEDQHNYMEIKDTPNKKRARLFAIRWASTYQKSLNFKPFHVKASEEKVPNWKNYLVLLTGIKDNYLLKKVCYSTENLNFAIVLDSNQSCNKEVSSLFILLDYEIQRCRRSHKLKQQNE